MKALWEFFRVHLLSDLRNRRSIFWVVIFPIILFSMLVLTFSNLGVKGSINFRIIIINEARATNKGLDFADDLVKAFKKLSFPQKDAMFTLKIMNPNEKALAIKEIKYSDADALIVIPPEFNSSLARSLLMNHFGFGLSQAVVDVYYVPNRASSSLAQGALNGIIGRINSILTEKVGYSLKAMSFGSRTIGAIMKSPSYTNFVAPGMLVIATFMTGMFLVAPKLSYMRYNHILKRYASTPVDMKSFLFGFSLSRLFVMILQYVGLLLFAILVLRASVNIFSWQAFVYYLFSCTVYTAIGFALGFMVSSTTAGGFLSSGITLPLEFLSGIYFPLFNLPWYINVFVYINPLWYSTNALRQYMGVSMSPIPMWMNILIPGIWLMASVEFSLLKSFKERG